MQTMKPSRRYWRAVIAVMALQLAGCARWVGSDVLRHARRGETQLIQVEKGGRYELYDSLEAHPIITCVLRAGDSLGFRRNDASAQQITAIAGETELTLEDRRYVWRRR